MVDYVREMTVNKACMANMDCCSHSSDRDAATQVIVMVDYVREMTVNKACMANMDCCSHSSDRDG